MIIKLKEYTEDGQIVEPHDGRITVDYVSGHTFFVFPNEVDPSNRAAAQLAPGWYAQREEDMDSGDITGPFATEGAAAHVLLADLGGASGNHEK